MRIDRLIVDVGREEHVGRHHVTVPEAEQVVFGAPFIVRTREGRYRLIGQTAAGRYLTVFVVPRYSGAYALVTARDATAAELRAYQARRRQ